MKVKAKASFVSVIGSYIPGDIFESNNAEVIRSLADAELVEILEEKKEIKKEAKQTKNKDVKDEN